MYVPATYSICSQKLVIWKNFVSSLLCLPLYSDIEIKCPTHVAKEYSRKFPAGYTVGLNEPAEVHYPTH